MLKHILSLLLAMSILLSCTVMGIMAEGSENLEVKTARIQELTKPVYSNHGSSDLIYCVEDHAVVYPTADKLTGVMDPHGQTLLSPVYSDVRVLRKDITAAQRPGTGYAVLYQYKQVTEHCYESITIRGSRVICKREGEGFDFFDLKMKPLSVPKYIGKWEIYDCLAEEHYLGRYYDADRYAYEYALLDKTGKDVYSYSNRGELIAISDYHVRSQGMYMTDVTWKGQRPVNENCNMLISAPDQNTYIVYCHDYSGDAEDAFYIVDAKMNVMFDGTKLSNTVVADTIRYINSHTLYGEKPQGGYVVMDLHGSILKELDADSLTLLGNDYDISNGALPNFGFYVKKGEKLTVYNADCQEVFTLNSIRFVSVYGYDFLASFMDGSKTLYDRGGNKLFDLAERDFYFQDGVIAVKENGKYALCDRKGEATTDFLFEKPLNTNRYGLVNLRNTGDGLYYLADGNGQILNGKGYLSWVSFNSNCQLTMYKSSNGLEGVLRYVGIDDPTFMDATKHQWYYDAVEYCAEKGLFSGTAAGRFSPEDTMTRAMLVTVLWRLDGQAVPAKEADFTDVPSGQWYSQAVAWASENGIVNGMGNRRFDPNGNVTREQIATILYRYAQAKGFEIEATGDLSTYPDGWTVSDYALRAMIWANTAGLINGIKSGATVTLQPQTDATRAQVATILVRFILISNKTG